MKQSKQQKIDAKGMAILEKLLVNNFLVRSQRPDYGTDYAIERVLDELVSGKVVSIQLKSFAKYQPNGNGTTSVKLKTANLKDYLDKVRQPVFLIAVDVKRESAYWLNVQDARGQLKANWRNQKTVTLQVPTKNEVADQSLFIAAFEQAIQKQPAVLANVEGKGIESLDPRFRMTKSEVTLDDSGSGKVMRHIKPIAPVDLKISFFDKEILDRVLAGQSVVVPSEGVKLTGSPIFEEPFSELHLAAYRGVPGEVRIRTSPGAKVDPVTLQGELRFGLGNDAFCGEFKFSGSELVALRIPNGPLTVGTGPKPLMIRLNPDVWIGQPLSHLPWFTEFVALCQTVGSGESSIAEFWSQGLHFLSVRNAPMGSPEIDATLGLLALIENLRPLFDDASLQPTYQKLNENTAPWLELLSSLLTDPDSTATLGGTFGLNFRNAGAPGAGVDSEGTIDEVGVLAIPVFDVSLPMRFRIEARNVTVARNGSLVSLSSTSNSELILSLPPAT